MKKTTQLRKLLDKKGALIVPGVYDCISAKLAEKAGFELITVTGAGVCASTLGYPDLGLITMTEMLCQDKNIARSVDIPVFVDCDTGYGNALNVRRTVEEFEAAGVAGLFFEDQVFPKRCGHFEGKQVIPEQEMVKKIEAALDARKDPDLVIMARTDAIATHGLEEAVKRARAYVKAGAEVIYIEAPPTREHLKKVAKAVDVHSMVNLVEGGKTPLIPVEELEEMGFKLVCFSGSAQKIAISAMQELFTTLRSTGRLDSILDKVAGLNVRSELLGLPRFYEMEKKYAVP
jgi:carboxyvinyl-carboxyphosphonate phosphorylmutase